MLSNRVGITYDFLNTDPRFTELNIFQIIHVLEEIKLICIFHIINISLQTVDDSKCQSDHSELFLTNNIIEKSFDEFYWKGVQKECHKPLKYPYFI